jgi:hypothetical protein
MRKSLLLSVIFFSLIFPSKASVLPIENFDPGTMEIFQAIHGQTYFILYLDDVQEQDTVRALNNLFTRKRNGGMARAIIFGLLGGSFIGAGISSGLAGNFLLAGVCVVVVVTGVSQINKYSDARLEQVLTNLQSGKPLPPEIAKKLKTKDFK